MTDQGKESGTMGNISPATLFLPNKSVSFRRRSCETVQTMQQALGQLSKTKKFSFTSGTTDLLWVRAHVEVGELLVTSARLGCEFSRERPEVLIFQVLQSENRFTQGANKEYTCLDRQAPQMYTKAWLKPTLLLVPVCSWKAVVHICDTQCKADSFILHDLFECQFRVRYFLDQGFVKSLAVLDVHAFLPGWTATLKTPDGCEVSVPETFTARLPCLCS